MPFVEANQAPGGKWHIGWSVRLIPRGTHRSRSRANAAAKASARSNVPCGFSSRSRPYPKPLDNPPRVPIQDRQPGKPRTGATAAPDMAIERENGCHGLALCPFKCTEPTFDCPYPHIFPLNERE